jgi:hypothetical protein
VNEKVCYSQRTAVPEQIGKPNEYARKSRGIIISAKPTEQAIVRGFIAAKRKKPALCLALAHADR